MEFLRATREAYLQKENTFGKRDVVIAIDLPADAFFSEMLMFFSD